MLTKLYHISTPQCLELLIEEFANNSTVLQADARQLLDLSVRKMQLSARAYHRILKLNRTIADLANSDLIEVTHVAEALQYRAKQHE